MPTESEKILPRIIPYLEEKTVLDLGCGDKKIVPWAIGVDNLSEWGQHPLKVDVRSHIDPEHHDLLPALFSARKDNSYDVVFSSHALEHMRSPILETLKYWSTFVKVGGKLILYLPDERHYVWDPSDKKRRNPTHKHFLTPETFVWYADQMSNMVQELLFHDVSEGRYSFILILSKLYS